MPLSRIAHKFNAYFSFTRGSLRSYPAPGGTWFIYPHDSMISDLTVLWAFFSEVCETLGEYADFETHLDAHPLVKAKFLEINQNGEFWSSKPGPFSQVPVANVKPGQLARILRNGFAHSNWIYDDLSAIDYWQKQGWDIARAPAVFGLTTRGKDNGMFYIADAIVTRAQPWDPTNFWGMPDLRIFAIHAWKLRYHLHLFLNNALNNANVDVFGNAKP